MKIVQINSVLNWGSTGKIVEQIGICVIESGNSSFVVYGRDKGPVKTNSIPINLVNTYMLQNHFYLMAMV